MIIEVYILLSKLYILALSVVLLVYSAISLRFGLAEPGIERAAKFCAAWLCPEEFSDARIVGLVRNAAIPDLKRALVLDPASAYAWADLGDALANANDSKDARYSFERALAAGPRNPIILFRSANFFFRSGDNERSMTTFAAILRNPELTAYYPAAFLTYTRMGMPIQTVLANGIPPQRIPAQALLLFLMGGNRLEDAEAAWDWALKRGLTDDRATADYLGFLIRQKQETRAADTWQELNASASSDYRRTNWLFDAGFEKEPKTGPFDWHYEPNADVQTQPQNGVLKLVFNGQGNVDYHGVWQQTVLTAGRWKIAALIKTDGITTDHGVSFRVTSDGLDISTEPMTGTHPWTEIEQTFEIKPHSSLLVRFEIQRPASRHFDNKITGTAWIKHLELAPIR